MYQNQPLKYATDRRSISEQQEVLVFSKSSDTLPRSKIVIHQVEEVEDRQPTAQRNVRVPQSGLKEEAVIIKAPVEERETLQEEVSEESSTTSTDSYSSFSCYDSDADSYLEDYERRPDGTRKEESLLDTMLNWF